ncbi:L2 [Leptonychotes weddellii papillomavirus 5]|uniref:Minor capsid protein L2 n=1 Tax=Leptonychotes weddellii papillomavirus 5 TaxID=2077306 RepID=A0A2I8B2S1_9PAPI|nr:L2 [Leptonychotes weddellii papillomavirus 5]AUT11921.1 L2 [Leptonychotes weddellii papillomavirus 5]
MAPRAARRKRADAGSLYRHCVQGGDCIPDVVNKFEHKTPADRILQIGGSLVYFGGAGISTGRGAGGYRPLGGTRTFTFGSRGAAGPGRLPPLLADTLGPVDATVYEGITFDSPAVSVGVDEGPAIELTPIGGRDGQPGSGAPTISTTTDSDVAILEVGTSTPSSRPTSRGGNVVSRSQFENPTFVPTQPGTPGVGEFSAQENILVDHSGGGVSVGEFEEIELGDLGERTDTGVPKTSTPKSRLGDLVSKAKSLYNRRVTQTRVENPEFLGRPSSLVEFGFENPAFEGDVTLTFDRVQEAKAAPDLAFRDIIKLSRPIYSEAPGGRVRVSRLGTKGTIRLRSGTLIGGQTHYFRDLSSIGAPSLEMSVLGQTSGESTVVLGSDSSIINGVGLEGTVAFPEEQLLLDELSENFQNSQLVFSDSHQSHIIELPRIAESPRSSYVIYDTADSTVVSHKGNENYFISTLTPPDTEPDTEPQTPDETPRAPRRPLDDSDGLTFDLHPGLLRRKKKRVRYYIE